MVVKESFGNAFAPFLINHYDEVYIVDQRYFELGAIDFIKQNGINELIFANNSFAACTPYHIQCIDNMRHQAIYDAPPAQTPSEEVLPETPSGSMPEVQEPQTPEYSSVPEEPEQSSAPQTPPAVPEAPYIPPQTYVPPQEPSASEPEADSQEDELYEQMDDIERSRRLRARNEK